MDEANIASGLAFELVDEVTGESSKKWALVVVVLVLAALGAIFLMRRNSARGLETPAEPAVETAA